MIRIFKKFKDLLDVKDQWGTSAGKYWRTKADGSGLEAVTLSGGGGDGVGITSIAKTSTVGNVDTYTITYSDNTTSTFTVTNGEDGVAPVITFTGTTIYVDGVAGPDLKGEPGNDSTVPGPIGVSVVSAAVDVTNHLILTLSDASTIDAGLLPTTSTEDFEPAIGEKGTAFNKNFGTGADEVMRGNTAIPTQYTDAMAESVVQNITSDPLSKLMSVLTDTKAPTGFINASFLAADQAVTVTNTGTAGRTLTLTPTNSVDFKMQYRGTRIPKTGAQTYDLSPHEAPTTYKVYVYYKDDGTFDASVNVAWNISAADAIPAAVAYWNGTEWRVGDETHGCTMDCDTHSRLHDSGALYREGFDLAVATGGNDTITLSSGNYADEDKRLYHNGTTVFDLWHRESMSSPTKMRFQTLTDTTRPYKLNAGVPQYEDGAAFVDIPDGGYFNCWLVATHCKQAADEIYIGAIAPQDYHLAVENARSESWSNLDIENRWIDEMCKLYRVTFQYSSGAVVYVEHLDVRGQDIEAQSTIQVDDVIIDGLVGNVGGNSGSAKEYLENLDAALTQVSYYATAVNLDPVADDGVTAYAAARGDEEGGTYTATNADDATYHQIGEVTTASHIDYVYVLTGVGGAAITVPPTKFTSALLYSGNVASHGLQQSIYNHDTAAWEDFGALIGHSTSFSTYQFDLPIPADYVSPNGRIYVRERHASGAGINGVNTHYIRVQYLVAQKQVSVSIDPSEVISQSITPDIINKAPSEDAVSKIPIIQMLGLTEVPITSAGSVTKNRMNVCSGTSYTATLEAFVAGDIFEIRMGSTLTGIVTVDAGAGKTLDGVNQTLVMLKNESIVLMAISTTTCVFLAKNLIPLYCTARQTAASFTLNTPTKITLNALVAGYNYDMLTGNNGGLKPPRPGLFDIAANPKSQVPTQSRIVPFVYLDAADTGAAYTYAPNTDYAATVAIKLGQAITTQTAYAYAQSTIAQTSTGFGQLTLKEVL